MKRVRGFFYSVSYSKKNSILSKRKKIMNQIDQKEFLALMDIVLSSSRNNESALNETSDCFSFLVTFYKDSFSTLDPKIKEELLDVLSTLTNANSTIAQMTKQINDVIASSAPVSKRFNPLF